MAEPALGEVGKRDAALAGVERVGEEDRIVEGRDGDAVAVEKQAERLEVVGDLEHRGLLEERLQAAERLVDGNLAGEQAGVEEVRLAVAVAERDIDGAPRPGRQRDADDLGQHRIRRSRLRGDGDMADLHRLGDQRLEAGAVGEGLIGLEVDRRGGRGRGGGDRPLGRGKGADRPFRARRRR